MNNLVFYEFFGDYIKYVCHLTKSYIIFKLTKNYVIYEDGVFDWDNCKIVLNLLKICFDDLKKFNVNRYRYKIEIDDSNFIDLDKWDIIEKNESFMTVECNLENAFENVVRGFIT